MDTTQPRKRSFGSSGLPNGAARQSKKNKKNKDGASKTREKGLSSSADPEPVLTVHPKEHLNKRKRRREKHKLSAETGDREAPDLSATVQSKAQQINAGYGTNNFKNPIQKAHVVDASAKKQKKAQKAASREATQPHIVSEGPTPKPALGSNKQEEVHSRKKKKKKKKKCQVKNVTSDAHRVLPGGSSAKSADEVFSMDWEAIERSADLRLATEDVVWSRLTAEQRVQMEERYLGRPLVRALGTSEQNDSSGESDSESSSDTSSDEEDDIPAVPVKVKPSIPYAAEVGSSDDTSSEEEDSAIPSAQAAAAQAAVPVKAEPNLPDSSASAGIESSDDASSDEVESNVPAARPTPAQPAVPVKVVSKTPRAAASAAQGANVSHEEDSNTIRALSPGHQQSDSRGLSKPFRKRKPFSVPKITSTNATLADTRAKFERLSSAISKRRQEASSDSDDDDSDGSTSDDSEPARKPIMRGSVQESFVSQMQTGNRDEDDAATSAAEESEADSDHHIPSYNANTQNESAEPANSDDILPASNRSPDVSEADAKPSIDTEPDSIPVATPHNDQDGSDNAANYTSDEDNDLEHEGLPMDEWRDADADTAQGKERLTAALEYGVTQLAEDAGNNDGSDHGSNVSGDGGSEEDSILSRRLDSSASDSTSSNVDASDVDMTDASAPDGEEPLHDSTDLNDDVDPVVDLHETDAEAQDPQIPVITGTATSGEFHQAGQDSPKVSAEDSSDSASDSSSDMSHEEEEDSGEALDEEIIEKPVTVGQSAIEPPRTQLTASQRQEAAGIPHSRSNTSATANVGNKTITAITDRGGTLSGHSPDLQAQANNDHSVLSFSDFVPGAVDTQANIAGESQELDNSVLEDVFENTRPLPEGEESETTPPRAGTGEELLTNNDSISHNLSQLSPASVDAEHRNMRTVRGLAPQELQAAPPPDLLLSDSDSENSEDGHDPGSTHSDVASATKNNAKRGQSERENGLTHSPTSSASEASTTSDSDSSPPTPIAGGNRLSSSIPASVRAAIEIATGKSLISSIKKRKMTGNTSTHFLTRSKAKSRQQSSMQTPDEKLPVLSRRQHSNAKVEQVSGSELDSQAEEGQGSDALPARAAKGTANALSPIRKTKSPAKKTGTISEHFIEDRVDLYNTTAGKRRKVPAGQSGNSFPPIGQPFFGIIQEKTWQEPFWMIVATVLLNKTTGRQAAPTFWKIKRRWPEADDLANSDYDELFEMIKHLGLQHQRTKRLQALATAWHTDQPQAGKRYRTLHYPGKGDGKQFKRDETIEEDADDCAGALEIAHIPGCGPYSWDSWRIFCRDALRGMADDYRGTNAQKDDFEPEWKRVLPGDKELRACLRWMWLKEGIVWNPLTGEKREATEEEMAKAERGEVELEDEIEAKFAAQAAGAEISSPENVTRGDYALDEAARREMRALDIPILDGSVMTQEIDEGADWALKNSQPQTTDVEESQREQLVKDVARPKNVQRKRGRMSGDDPDAVLSATRRTRTKKGEGIPVVGFEETITKKTAVPEATNGATNTVTTRRQSARLLENTGLV